MRRFPMAAMPPLALAALLAVPAAAPAFTFLDLVTGDEAPLPDARSIALGRTRIAAPVGAFTGAGNPALLARLEGPVASIGGSAVKLKETRSVPAFDSFDGYLVESVYVLNDEVQWEGGLGLATARSDESLPFPIGVGLSWAPVRDFQYVYSEEVRDNNAFTQPRDRLLALNEIQGDGVLGAWTLGVGFAPAEEIAIGVALEFLGGDADLVQRTRWIQDEYVDEVSLAISDLSGIRETIGVAYAASHRLELGAVWRHETTLDGEYVIDGAFAELAHLGTAADPDRPGGSFEITLPEEWSLGATYRPRAKTRTTVRVEASLTEWSDYENGLWEDLRLDDVWDMRLGIEHVFYNGFPARFGFHYRPSPRNDQITTTAFTFGGAFDVGPLVADLAFEIANRDYRAEDVFDDADFGGTSHPTTDLVEEVGSSAFLTLSYAIP